MNSRTGKLLACTIAVAAVPTVLALGARWWWFFELFTHFRVYYAAAFLVMLVICLIARQWKLALLSLLLAGWNLIPYYAPPISPTAANLRVMTTNVQSRNGQHDRFLEEVDRRDPDILLVVETNGPWLESLHALDEEYPHQQIGLKRGDFGYAIYSRIPLTSAEEIALGDPIPSVKVEFEVDGRHVTLIGIHPFPPVSPSMAHSRNSQLRATADEAAGIESPLIVMGDLNITPFSPHFRDLIARGGLRDTRLGYGIQPTWRAIGGLVRIPIDYVLVSDGILVRNFQVGDNVGSDHLPVIVDLVIPKK